MIRPTAKTALALCAALLATLTALPAASAWASASASNHERVRAATITVKASEEKVLTASPVTYAGTVSPKRQVNLVLQAKAGSGAWKKAATGHTSPKGRYKMTYRPSTPGAFTIRVVVVGKKSARSIEIPLLVERWLNIADLDRTEGCAENECEFRQEQIGGVKYPRGVFFDDWNLDGARLTYQTQGCSAYRGVTGISDYALSGDDGHVAVLVDGTERFAADVHDGQQAQKIALDITGSQALSLNFEPGADGAVFADSQVRCSH